MTLRPSVVSPASMKNLRSRRGDPQAQKKMVIDCRHDSHWGAIHDPKVNGVVLRRRPIRAIETFFDKADDQVFAPQEFVCAQSRLRNELAKALLIQDEAEEMRRKFLMNDIANWMRVLIGQSRSREYLVRLCSGVSDSFQTDKTALKMIVCYRSMDITFRQPKDNDEKTVSPYSVALFRGEAYESPVEWLGKQNADKAFYLTIEPHTKRRAIGL